MQFTEGVSTEEFFYFFRLGIEHLLTGWDHLAFLLALLLVLPSWRRFLIIVTVFTLSHSLTLSCAAIGIFSPPVRVTEIIIALSIVWAGIDPLFKSHFARRTTMVAAFGLFHGFGFSSLLKESLPDDSVLLPLIGFNTGVEAGQILFALPIFPLLLWWKGRSPKSFQPAQKILSFSIVLAGLAWLVERIFF